MTEPSNRTRKVTRKAGPPEAVEFQAPQSADTDGRSEKSTEKKKSKVPAKTSADNSGNSRNGNGNEDIYRKTTNADGYFPEGRRAKCPLDARQ